MRFTTNASGSRTDTLVIPSNDLDQASVNFGVNGTGTASPEQEVVIVSTCFEDRSANGWYLDGAINVDGTEAIGKLALCHKRIGTSELDVSTIGSNDVKVTMHLATTSQEQGDGCFAEVSTNGGNSWTSVVEVHDGNDTGEFFTNTVSPAGAENNSNLKLRFRSTGQHRSD